ncbi:hypothetical protein MA9V1_033 [Chryseobacterium phage MA9V-1]|nr:hypothetical protein MA9V1_033 [Chryseobacterium phage MA9V-1]
MAFHTELGTRPVLLHIQNDTAYEIRFRRHMRDHIKFITFDDQASSEAKVRYAISYSFDNRNWSPYDPDMLGVPAYIEMHKQTSGLEQFWLKFKIICNFTEAEDFYRLFCIDVNCVAISPADLAFTEISTYRGITNSHKKNLFKPYSNLDTSIDRMLAMANVTNEVFGHEVFYVKVKEVDESFNATFKTYAKFVADSIKKIKVSIPDNDFKANTLVYSEFNVEYEQDLAAHIVLEEFQRAFGIGAYPQAKDIVYIPQIGRTYDVVAANSELQLGNVPVYSIAKLRKHVTSTDVFTDGVINDAGFDINHALDYGINDFENSTSASGDEGMIVSENNDPYLSVDDDNGQKTGNIISDANVEGLQAQSLQDYYYLKNHDAIRLYTHKSLEVVNQPLKINDSPIFFRYYKPTLRTDGIVIQYTRVKMVNPAKFFNLSLWFKSTKDNHKMISLYNILLRKQGNNVELVDSKTNVLLSSIAIADDSLWHFVDVNINVETMMLNFSVFAYDQVAVEFKLIREEWAKSTLIKTNKYIDKLFVYSGMLFSNVKLYAKSFENDQLISLAVDRTFNVDGKIVIDTVFDIAKPTDDI